MSGTTTTTAAPPTRSEPMWAKPAVGAYAFIAYAMAFVMAWLLKNDTMLTALSTAAAVNATGVINYYFGSSSGSTAKTEMGVAAPVAVPPGGTTVTTTTAPAVVVPPATGV